MEDRKDKNMPPTWQFNRVQTVPYEYLRKAQRYSRVSHSLVKWLELHSRSKSVEAGFFQDILDKMTVLLHKKTIFFYLFKKGVGYVKAICYLHASLACRVYFAHPFKPSGFQHQFWIR